jgi:hypothetical protein
MGRLRASPLAVGAAVILAACGQGGGGREAHAQFRKEIDRRVSRRPSRAAPVGSYRASGSAGIS